ncbi:MAG TPA: hypothetical protein VIY54_12060 [Steroidobacteraceae bacterium]
MLTIDTLRKVHEHHGAISAHCRACERHAWLALPALIEAGLGDRLIVALHVRCTMCGRRGEISIIWRD